MSRKSTELDKAISRALHNTRNKVYRLKKRGASERELSYIDPRKNDWRASKSGMPGSKTLYEGYRKGELNPRQKYEFLKQLQDFNERENSYTVTDEGGFISAKTMQRFYATQEGINRMRAATLNRIIKNADGKGQGLYYQYGADPVQIEKMSEWEFKEKVARELAPINRTNPFSNAARLVRGLKMLRDAQGSMRKVLARSKHWHKVAVNRLRDNGDNSLADVVANMTENEFLSMTVLTDFNAKMGDFQYKEYWLIQAHSRERDFETKMEESSAYMSSIVDTFAPKARARAEKKARRK